MKKIVRNSFFATSPRSVAFEATSVQGFSIDKKHYFGIGFGIGVLNKSYRVENHYDSYRSSYTTEYMPVFLNYRFCFKPDKTFSPHFNVALGGLVTTDGGGLYSAVAMGFRAGHFSFSSGISFMAVTDSEWWDFQRNDFNGWLYPFGIVLKCGFIF